MVFRRKILHAAKCGFLLLLIITASVVICLLYFAENLSDSEEKVDDEFYYSKPDFPFSEEMLDDNFETCLLASQDLVKKSSFNLNQNSFYNFTRYDYLNLASKNEQEKWFPLMSLLLDFSTLMISFLKLEVVLIEPSLLFCMLSPSNKELLLRRKLNVTSFWNSQQVITFGIRGDNASILEKENVIHRIKSFGFVAEVVKQPTEEWMKNQSTNFYSNISHYPSHVFLKRGNWTIHLVVLHQRGHFLWHAGLSNRVSKIIPPTKELHFVDSDSAYDSFKFISLGIWGEPLNPIYIPSDPVYFLFEIGTSEFIECNSTLVSQFILSQGDKKLGRSTFSEKSFNLRTVVALQELKLRLRPFLMNFWIWSGTLLGWYRQCDIIPYTSDVDFGAWSSEVDDLGPLLKRFTGNKHLKLQERMGLVQEGLEFNLNCHNQRTDLFFLYEENNGTWYAGHRPKKGYYFKYHHPNFTLCSASLLGHKVLVPCQTESVIQTEYGSQWMLPVSSWDYESSIKNRGPNVFWDKDLLEKVYAVY